jgi:hypothetical protein
MTVQLPNGVTLQQFKQQIYNLYYSRDAEALRKLLDSLKEKENADSQS